MSKDDDGNRRKMALMSVSVVVALMSILALLMKWWFGGSYSYSRDVAVTLAIAVLVFCFVGTRLLWEVVLRVALAADGLAKLSQSLPPTMDDLENGPFQSAFTDEEANQLEEKLKSRRIPARQLVVIALVSTPLAIWSVISISNGFFERAPVERQPVSRERQPVVRAEGPQVGLALSGGGYRAAVMHAGVLAALEYADVHVTHLSVVSGGSIIGAFYASGGTPKAFLEAVQRGRFNLKADLSDIQNIAWLVWPSFNRTRVQANLINRVLLNGLRAGDTGSRMQPLLMICTTDLIHGEGVGVARDGVLYQPLPQLGFEEAGLPVTQPDARFAPSDRKGFPKDEQLAQIVAASGAVPAVFPPVEESHDGRPLQLADGGIFDNLGITLLIDRHRLSAAAPQDGASDSWMLDMAIVSDGGAPLARHTESSLVGQIERMMDVVYGNAIAALKLRKEDGLPVLRLSPEQLQAAKPQEWATRLAELARRDLITPETAAAQCLDGVQAFERTSTLNDQPGESAREIYRLGECLVWWNKEAIHTTLKGIAGNRR